MEGYDFSLGKLTVGLLNGNDGELVVEYTLENGQKTMEIVPATDFLGFLEIMSEKIKGFKQLHKENAEKHFDARTKDNLRRIGIYDLSYLTRGMD